MELRVLKYFLAVAREENITKAAALLHLTQPTLSRQLMQLEEELGVQLFRRSRYHIELTEDGMLLRRRAQELVDLAEKTTREFTMRETELMGEIAIGAGETRSMSFLSRATVSFRERYPKVTFRIFSATADDVKERLDTGLLDMGLLTEPVDVGRYAFCRMKERDRWGVLVRLDSPLAGLDSVTPDDLEQVPLIISGRERVQRELANWFGDRWERLQIAASFNLILNAANMVRYGVGTALSFDLNFSFDDLRFIPLSPTMDTGTVLVWKKDLVLTPVVEAFHQHIKNVQ
ncbi:LysR family transcriptional regulator [Pseudoflavonifractor phocaeensis]|uniref:LysR family transcriptional regulator n=1 Tax=Pseudoflavonifractor phocaeensis TaxID=1870988 RepID=UPI001956DE72|nr:LysR family transcriptional regulator [Pseudoflavonifractor phocaeensis]MBM6926911.1 LysR family transcriptional regulator [Pseudoflavonifractor phocaeensis]